MASYRLEVKSGKKGMAVQHSSYINRDGKHHVREDLVESGYGNMPLFADTARILWSMADKFERSNGSAYREYVATLPLELTPMQQSELVIVLIHDLAGSKPYQYAVHAPMSSLAGVPNPHLHLMITDRIPDGIERAADRMFSRYNSKDPANGGCRKDSGGRTRMQLRDDLIMKRKRVADIQNEHLAMHGHTVRVDHLSLKAQGVERKAERHLGQAKVRVMSNEERHEYVALRCRARRKSR
jgi:hypothetical protein